MIALTGIGPVTPIGIGKDHFWNNVISGYSCMKKSTRFLSSQEFYCCEISRFNVDEHLQDSRFRRAADISKYALVATQLAIHDANIKEWHGENTALVMGITNGPLNYTQEFHTAFVKEGIDGISPSLFSESVLNAPASNIAISSIIRGPVQTLLGGTTGSLKAIIFAFQMLSTGIVDRAIVASSEELNELSLFYYSRFGYTMLSEGSGAICIEKVKGLEEPSPYCYLSGMASHCNPSNPKDAFYTAVQQSLKMADLELKDIDFIMSDSSLPAVRKHYQNIIPSGCIIPLTGNAFCVNAMWHIVLASLSIKYRTIPVSIRTDTMKISDNISHIMICSAEEKGAAAAVILSKCL
ncbi:MAG: beta-ketoacyl synthase N-terminal-like domain-containing protein [Nitrospirota bacterium]